MIKIIFISLAPVFIIAGYLYYRDKYEREPFGMLLRAIIAGCIITIPTVFTENFLSRFAYSFDGKLLAMYNAFVVAGFTEELYKFLAFMFIIWPNRNFNEKFDGIIYAAFISLGFALVENLLYVFSGGYQVGMLRAFTAVPAHALFGIAMGYYLGLAKFAGQRNSEFVLRAFFIPFMLHGLYDFILMANSALLMLGFIPFIVWLWFQGFRHMKTHSDNSRFRRDY